MAYAALTIKTDQGVPLAPMAHHRLWLRLVCDERIRRLVIIAPPESAKTTWIVSAFVGAYIGFWPEKSVIIGSVTSGVAEKRSLSLRTAVESRTWQDIFPGISPVKADDGLKWTSTEWSLAPGGKPRDGRLHPTVSAHGTGTDVVGARADLVLADDILDFDNTRTQHQRKTVEQWFSGSLLSRLKSRVGRVVVIGTQWHHKDLLANLRDQDGWVTCHLPLLSENEQVYANMTYPADWDGPVLGELLGKAEVPA